MASPFAKYQSEQVQQIAPGFVEAYGRAGASIGDGIATIGAGVGKAIEDADKKATEEAKLRGALAPYLKNDPRTAGVEQGLKAGLLTKAEDGNVIIAPGQEANLDPARTKSYLDFYNQTGGDGSKLGGRDLMAFASEFESQKKYEADISGRERAKLDVEKTRAELDKLKADTAATYAKAYGAEALGALGRGEDVSKMPGFSVPGAAPASGPAPTPTLSFSLPTYNQPTGVSPATTDVLNYTPTPAPAPKATAPAPVAPVVPVTAKPLTAADVITPTNVDPLVRIQAETNDQLSRIDTKLAKDIAFEQANLGAILGKPGVDADAAIKLSKARVDVKASIATADKEVVNRRLTGAQEEYKLKTQAAAEALKITDEARKVAEEKRKVEDARVGAIKTRIELGETAGAAPAKVEPPKTFAEKQERFIKESVPSGVGGTMRRDAEDKAFKSQQAILESHPANFSVGVFTPGAKEYMVDLKDRPTSAPLTVAKQNGVNENLEGYEGGKSFLIGLKVAVESGSDSTIKNYLNRFALTTADPDIVIKGELSKAFGVATFRKGIVAGGNFSDADRQFVQGIITDISTASMLKGKDWFRKQTQALGEKIDEMYKDKIVTNGGIIDYPTSRKYLEREGDQSGLAQLKKSEQFYYDFNLPVPGVITEKERASRIKSAVDKQQSKK
jgi:hypothetical protein